MNPSVFFGSGSTKKKQVDANLKNNERLKTLKITNHLRILNTIHEKAGSLHSKCPQIFRIRIGDRFHFRFFLFLIPLGHYFCKLTFFLLNFFQANFQIDCNPDGQDLERIADISGLSKRVVQVSSGNLWIQKINLVQVHLSVLQGLVFPLWTYQTDFLHSLIVFQIEQTANLFSVKAYCLTGSPNRFSAQAYYLTD